MRKTTWALIAGTFVVGMMCAPTAQAQTDSPQDIVMRPGEMVLLHPLVLHASNPNQSVGARIGFSATYASPALRSSRTPIAWVRGDGPKDRFDLIEKPPLTLLEDAVAAYRARNYQILFCQSASPEATTPAMPKTKLTM